MRNEQCRRHNNSIAAFGGLAFRACVLPTVSVKGHHFLKNLNFDLLGDYRRLTRLIRLADSLIFADSLTDKRTLPDLCLIFISANGDVSGFCLRGNPH